MNNVDHTQTIGRKVVASDKTLTTSVDSSAAMIPPAAAENPNEDDNIWNWVSEIRLEEFHPDYLNYLTLQKPEFGNNAYQLPSKFGQHANPKLPREQFLNPNEEKFNTLPPELRSLILWQSKNVEAAVETGALGKAPLDDDITIINHPLARDATGKNRKRKGIQVDDNFENNARSTYSINDKLMALHELVPGSQKADMATTLGETVEYLAEVKIREYLQQEEVKQLRQAMDMIMKHSSVHRHMNGPVGTPLNMGVGVNTQLRGLESRPRAHPNMTMLNSSMSVRMNKPSVMPSLLQHNSAAAASSLFVPPQVPTPSQQQRTLEDKQPRQAMDMIMKRSSVHRHMNRPVGTPLNMGVNTQLRGLESRPRAHPNMRMLNSSLSVRMNDPSVMPSLLQHNSAATASSLFVPPKVPAPSQQQRTLQYKKSTYSIKDKLMALHELVPGTQKADMATTLGETVEYLAEVKIQEYLQQEEVKQLRHAMDMIMKHSSVHRHMNRPLRTPILNMGVNTQLWGLESRPRAHPNMRMLNSSLSVRMNNPSVMPSLLQQNSAAAASSLFVPPQVPAPSQQQRTVQDKIDDKQGKK